MVMVTFDQIIMMPTLSIHTNSFLNQTFSSLCSSSKIKQQGSQAHFQILQKPFQIDLRDFQKWNSLTERRSPLQEKP